MSIHHLLRASALGVACLLPAAARAADFGVVEELTEPGPKGHRPVKQTGEAVVVRDGVETPLSVGDTLAVGDTVRTAGARLVIAIDGRQRVVVDEGSELVLQDRSVLQQLGDAYYRVRGAFSTTFGTVEATVEGTEYLVDGGETITVGVKRGVVRVASAGQSVAVKKGHAVTVTPGEPPPEPEKWGRAKQGQQTAFTWPRLSPPVTIGGRAGFSAARSGFGRVEGFARLSLPAGWRVVLDGGLDDIFGGSGTSVPLGVGVGHAFGPLTLAGQLTPTLFIDNTCGTIGILEIGGAGSAALSVPLGFGLRLESEVEGGYAGTPVVAATLGLGVDL